MKTSKAILIAFGIIALIVMGLILYFNILFPPVLSLEETKRDFLKNQDNIMTVTEYLINSEYSDIYIVDNYDIGVMSANSTKDTVIEEPRVVSATSTLFRRGYSVIDKNGNTISFQRSTRLADFGSGVAYSIDGIHEPELQLLTRLEPLSVENWYYYEEDYNEFRRRIKE